MRYADAEQHGVEEDRRHASIWGHLGHLASANFHLVLSIRGVTTGFGGKIENLSGKAPEVGSRMDVDASSRRQTEDFSSSRN